MDGVGVDSILTQGLFVVGYNICSQPHFVFHAGGVLLTQPLNPADFHFFSSHPIFAATPPRQNRGTLDSPLRRCGCGGNFRGVDESGVGMPPALRQPRAPRIAQRASPCPPLPQPHWKIETEQLGSEGCPLVVRDKAAGNGLVVHVLLQKK